MSAELTKTARANAGGGVVRSGVLRRACDCGNHTPGGAECDGCRSKGRSSALRLQTKLAVGSTDDPLELEADRAADDVMARPSRVAGVGAPPLVRRSSSSASAATTDAPESVERVVASGGRSLDPAVRGEMEARFGSDFSGVRVHTGLDAESSARDVRARAYTVGSHVVFGAGGYAPEAHAGRRLLAHELAHVVQQGAGGALVRRCPDAAMDTQYDAKTAAVKAHAEYGKLPATDPNGEGSKALVDEIVVEAKKRTNCLFYIGKLRTAFDTPVNAPGATRAMNVDKTAKAAQSEATRLTTKAGGERVDLETSTVAGRSFKRVAGRDGNFQVDASDPNNVAVKVRIHLAPTKSGKEIDDLVKEIKSMKDAIEKAASTRGYVVSIDFVDATDPDTFEVDVNPETWTYSNNWAGGDPTTFAHELHHRLGIDVDRYDYTDHATNKDMGVAGRVQWIRDELKKAPGYNDPTSLMASGLHPSDADVCLVVDPGSPDCVAKRKKVSDVFRDITTKYASVEERILNTIGAYQKSDPDTMMAVLRDVCRARFGASENTALLARLADPKDPLGKAFLGLTKAQQDELKKLLPVVKVGP